MRRGGGLLEVKVGLRKGPQEYHSAPIRKMRSKHDELL